VTDDAPPTVEDDPPPAEPPPADPPPTDPPPAEPADEAIDPEEPTSDEVDAYRMTLLEHLVELRNRLIKAGAGVLVGLCIALPFGAEIFDFLIAPTSGAFPEGSGFIYTEVAEKFITDLKLGFFGALFLALPWLAYQSWAFVGPGLYKHERRMVVPFVLISTLLFVGGAAVCYYGILPYAMNFFINFATDEISANIKVSSYLRFVIRFIVAFGLIFETPLVIFFLARLGLVTAKGLRKFRRYAIVLGFALAAVITPPDPGSQLAVGLPFILLYEIGILTAVLWGKPPLAERLAADGEGAEDEGEPPVEDA
jgi:sec-independent protein translocase protein TatC